MAKFELLYSQHRVAVIKIGHSMYYVDSIDPHNILIYNQEFVIQNVIIPEYWLPEVTRGEVTMATLKVGMAAFEKGYAAGYAIKSKRHFSKFVDQLVAVLVDPESAKQFLSIFWIELRPFNIIKELVSKILSNSVIRQRTARASRLTLDRYIVRAKYEGDKEFSDQVFAAAHELSPVVFNPMPELLILLDIPDTDVPHLEQNVRKIVNLR